MLNGYGAAQCGSGRRNTVYVYNISLRLTPHIELSSQREKTHRNSFFYLMGHNGIEE